MQSEMPWFGVQWGRYCRQGNTVCHLQDVLVRLQDNMQFMPDDRLG